MSKLSFRPRALDAIKPLPIYISAELPDLPENSAINRAVPQMPSGMEKEEESEHHLQRAIVTGLIIPTPEVEIMSDREAYERLYPANYKQPRQLIHMQPFLMEEDIPDYDIDSDDEKWLSKQKLDITPLKFEEMMDRLEKNCAQNFASQNRKELLLKDDDEISIAVFDYWLSKRLSTQPQPLVPLVKTEANNRGPGGNINNNNPYLAFRRRVEKMQTRKNRKNDETSYEKMVKLRRDLSTALQLLEKVKKREKAKKELLELTIQLFEKRYQANDMSGALLAEVSSYKSARPAFAPIYTNQFPPNHSPWPIKPPKEEVGNSRKEKRQYKKRKHKTPGFSLTERFPTGNTGSVVSGSLSSGEDDSLLGIGGSGLSPSPPHVAFPFHRNKNCSYHAPLSSGGVGNYDWTSPEEGGSGEERYRFSLASLSNPQPKCVGLVRRRIGRGGRVILDRAGPSRDDFWSSLDFTILDSANPPPLVPQQPPPTPFQYTRHFRPKTPPPAKPTIDVDSDYSILDSSNLLGSTLSVQIESLADCEATTVDLDLGELFPELELDSLRSDLAGKRPRKGGGDSMSGGGSSCSEFIVTDERWRSSSGITGGTETPSSSSYYSQISSSPSSSTSLMSNHTLPPPPSDTVLCDRVPPFLANGPINHNDHGGWGQQQSSGSPVVCKWSAGNSSVTTLTNSSPATNALNAKLTARSTLSHNSSENGGSGDTVHKLPTSNTGQQAPLVHSTPMEVT